MNENVEETKGEYNDERQRNDLMELSEMQRKRSGEVQGGGQ